MEMHQEGKTVDEMQAVIYDRYGNFGPSTDEAKESSFNGAPPLSMSAAEHPSANILVQRCEEENRSCAQD